MAYPRKYFYQCLSLLFTLSAIGFAAESVYTLPEPKTQEEALFLRRIAEFWNEGNYDIVKSQMADFLEEFPDSSFADTLYAILGDLSMKDRKYQEAVGYYGKIEKGEVIKEFLLNKMQCLRELGWHSAIAEDCEPYLDAFASDQQKHQKLLYILAEAHYNLALRSPKDSETRRIYARQAKLRYEALLESEYSKDILSPLAYTYHLLGDSQKAADIYLTLAQKVPAKKEEMLFQAAALQVEFNKDLAIQTFGQVCNLGKSKAPEAAYNRMILYYETQKYPEIILAKDQLLSLVPKDKVPLLHFFLGRSHFALEDYKRAAQEFTLFVESDYKSEEERKVSLLSLLDCACLLAENPLFEKIVALYQKSYPDSPELPRVLFTKAMMNKQLSHHEEAKKDFVRLLTDYPNAENHDKMLYEYAHLLYIYQNWEEARVKFKEFVSKHESSPLAPLAWRYLINSSIESEAKSQNPAFAKEILATDLEEILRHSHLLSDKENDELSFMLAKIDYEVEDYESAIAFLDPFTKETPDSPLLADAHLLLAYCYKKAEENLEKFCFHAEKALALKPDMPQQQTAHLALYNAYLERNGKEEKYWDQAAEHLYLAKASGAKLQPVNQSWLAGFFHEKVKKFFDRNWKSKLEESPEMKHLVERAIQLLEVPGDDKERLPELITLADLYGLQGDIEKQIDLLEKLQSNNPDLSESYKRQARFDLAKAYTRKGNKNKALQLFEEIANVSLQSYMGAYAALESARMRFFAMKDAAMKENNSEIIAILARLKDLTIQKTYANEPIHLEAAFDYIDIQCFLQNNDDNIRAKLLEKTIIEFEGGEDILSQDYQAARKQMPEKEALYTAYLDLMEGEYHLAMAAIAKKEAKPEDAANSKKTALTLLEKVAASPMTAYLHNRSQRALAACGNL